MVYDARTVANHMLEIARLQDKTLTHTKLQKLLYFAHGWHLAFYDEPLMGDGFQAWQYGPVSYTLYHAARQYNDQPIDSQIVRIICKPNEKGRDEFWCVSPPMIPDSDTRTLDHLQAIFNSYGKHHQKQLCAAARADGTPWALTKAKWPCDDWIHLQIGNDVIRDYFKARAGNANAAVAQTNV